MASGAPGRRRTPGKWWSRFRRSAFLPATVLVLIVSAAAALFAGSYTYGMANPTPRAIPSAVVGPVAQPRGKEFLTLLEQQLSTSVKLHPYATQGEALNAVEAQKVFAIFHVRDGGTAVTTYLSSASGASVAQLLAATVPAVGKKVGVAVTVKDVNPLQPGDPRGLALFYISIAAVIVGFVGAIQLNIHAQALRPLVRMAFTATYAMVGAFAIAATVDWLLGALNLPFAESWAILAFTMFTSGMTFSAFNILFGRWAMLPTWGLNVLLGNPSSGGAVSWPLLPSFLGVIGRWLPTGASINAQHTAVYFAGYQHAFPFLVLAGWCLAACTVFWTLRRRHPASQAERPAQST